MTSQIKLQPAATGEVMEIQGVKITGHGRLSDSLLRLVKLVLNSPVYDEKELFDHGIKSMNFVADGSTINVEHEPVYANIDLETHHVTVDLKNIVLGAIKLTKYEREWEDSSLTFHIYMLFILSMFHEMYHGCAAVAGDEVMKKNPELHEREADNWARDELERMIEYVSIEPTVHLMAEPEISNILKEQLEMAIANNEIIWFEKQDYFLENHPMMWQTEGHEPITTMKEMVSINKQARENDERIRQEQTETASYAAEIMRTQLDTIDEESIEITEDDLLEAAAGSGDLIGLELNELESNAIVKEGDENIPDVVIPGTCGDGVDSAVAPATVNNEGQDVLVVGKEVSLVEACKVHEEFQKRLRQQAGDIVTFEEDGVVYEDASVMPDDLYTEDVIVDNGDDIANYNAAMGIDIENTPPIGHEAQTTLPPATPPGTGVPLAAPPPVNPEAIGAPKPRPRWESPAKGIPIESHGLSVAEITQCTFEIYRRLAKHMFETCEWIPHSDLPFAHPYRIVNTPCDLSFIPNIDKILIRYDTLGPDGMNADALEAHGQVTGKVYNKGPNQEANIGIPAFVIYLNLGRGKLEQRSIVAVNPAKGTGPSTEAKHQQMCWVFDGMVEDVDENGQKVAFEKKCPFKVKNGILQTHKGQVL